MDLSLFESKKLTNKLILICFAIHVTPKVNIWSSNIFGKGAEQLDFVAFASNNRVVRRVRELNMYVRSTKLVRASSVNWLDKLNGYLGADAYSTAWVGMVPSMDNPNEPEWESAVAYLRSSQLGDGGWGEPEILYAYERTISTLAAIQALLTWSKGGIQTEARVRKGLNALRTYAKQLPGEPFAPVGFELLLPSFIENLQEFSDELPLGDWDLVVSKLYHKKLEALRGLKIDYDNPRAWWFSLELLPIERLAQLDNRILNDDGSIQTSVAATAAFLRAKRLAGDDVPQAANFLNHVIEMGNGSVPFSSPAENFERVWGVDNFRRIGLHPQDPMIMSVIEMIDDAWHRGHPGLSSSNSFDVNDGDDTFLGLGILNWADIEVDIQPALDFWSEDHFRSYMDEADTSISANIHALEALRLQRGLPYRHYAETVTGWLRAHMGSDIPFHDKWHLSPLYTAAHALHATINWDQIIVDRCLDFILSSQFDNGGWGWFGTPTLEETSHCVIALGYVSKYQGFEVDDALRRAATYLASRAEMKPVERLWIGKTLFRPEGVLEALLHSAYVLLVMLGYADNLFPVSTR